jgi:hypothetical protein
MLARVGKATSQQIEELRVSVIAHLNDEGSFELPPQETSQALIDAYFRYSYTALPILDKSRFLQNLKGGSISHLLLNAVYLTATVYCSDLIIANAGFASRYAASLTFYRKAKSLHDAGYETDSIATIQATFLMCHWWSGILEPKDPWYWLGISTGMAQALGLHQACVDKVHQPLNQDVSLTQIPENRIYASKRKIEDYGEGYGGYYTSVFAQSD